MTELTEDEKNQIRDNMNRYGDLRWEVIEQIIDQREKAVRAKIADEIDAELGREISRLVLATGSDPFKQPMLGNWLGGIKVGLDIARGEDPNGKRGITITHGNGGKT